MAHFVIRGEESQASYIARVQPFNQQAQASVVGSTSAIAGDVFLYPLTWMIVPDSVSQITVNLTTLESDEPQRDTALRDHYLESSRFPEAVYLLRKVSPADPSEARTTVAPGGGLTANVPIKLEGDLTIRETTRPVTWVGTATLEGDRLTGTVSTTIALGDYGIPAIKLAFLEVEASVTVELQLAADRVTAG
ncbi:MAG: hypothetical protein CL878_12060 [Dehalococcoidia bacterium]|nr:hypothetical protein [Dehalococcoidia bacterium]